LRHGDLLDHPSLQGRGSEASPTDHERHVARTFALSYERLDAADADDGLARSLLARAAYFAAGEPIPRPLLLATVEIGDDGLRGEDVLKRLTELGLLEEEADGAVKVHRLVASFARRTGDEGAQAAVEDAVISEAYRLNVAGFPAPLLAWQVHLRAVTENSRDRDDERSAALCANLGYHLRTIGDLRGARPHYERALAIREKVLGAEHPDTARSLNNLGGLLQDQGDLAGARTYCERAHVNFEKVLGAEHPDTALSLNNLGLLLKSQGDLAGARQHYERALAILEAGLGPDHRHTKIVRKNLESLDAGWQG
jgi:tetratricopeptide (TPR) repeat protein